MEYFCTEKERKGTCYHEFCKGSWDYKTFWQEDSILIHDDVCWKLKLDKLFAAAIPEYDSCGNTPVTPDAWERVCSLAEKAGGEVWHAVCEADGWVRKNFETEDIFYILGL